MSEMLDVSPTKGNLLKLQKQLKGLQSRHDLLDRKRRVLIRELIDRRRDAEEAEKKLGDFFPEAHEATRIALMHVGSDRLRQMSFTADGGHKVDIRTRAIMGLKIPSVSIDVAPLRPCHAMEHTSAYLDEARVKWTEVLKLLSETAGVITATWRLAMEARKTQRQVNALESVIIPRYRKTIKYIEDRLEEEERADIVSAKKLMEQ